MHVAAAIRSYRDLPKILYHFQIKERDEPRPRAGVLRTREFIMKDSYSFDRDEEGLQASYDLHAEAYARIFDRAGLEWYKVESDVGMMGGSMAHEFMAPCAAGENDVALAPGYAANVEIASADAQPAGELTLTGEHHTPGATTIEAVAGALGVPASRLLKAFPVVLDGGERVDVFVRGDHRINEIKLRNALKSDFRPGARTTRSAGPPGFLGPGRRRADRLRRGDRRGRLRRRREPRRLPRGRRGPGGRAARRAHRRRRRHGRRAARSGSSPRSRSGTSSSSAPATPSRSARRYLDENGKEQLVCHGLLRHRPGAHRAAAASSSSTTSRASRGRRRSRRTTSRSSSLGKPVSDEAQAAEALYEELRAVGLRRPARRPRGRRGREVRRRRAARRPAAADDRQALAGVRRGRGHRAPRAGGARPRPARRRGRGGARTVARAPLTFRRLSRPRPLRPAAARDRARGAVEPVDDPQRDHATSGSRCCRSSSCSRCRARRGPTRCRRSSSPLIAWGDYADGIAARVTGQYSKLGALLDPIIDRALVLSGVVVVWHFETLPRWALAVLALREVVQLFYGQWALRHGIDLHVNWPGRLAVWPVMSAIFAALVGLGDSRRDPALHRARVLDLGHGALHSRRLKLDLKS